jgi:hypothetical protein
MQLRNTGLDLSIRRLIQVKCIKYVTNLSQCQKPVLYLYTESFGLFFTQSNVACRYLLRRHNGFDNCCYGARCRRSQDTPSGMYFTLFYHRYYFFNIYKMK